MTSQILPYIFLFLYIFFDAFCDSIVHHDSYKNLGYFFSKQAAETPKKSLFQKYFPMFFDAWHLAKMLKLICFILAIGFVSPLNFGIAIIMSGLLFNLLYK